MGSRQPPERSSSPSLPFEQPVEQPSLAQLESPSLGMIEISDPGKTVKFLHVADVHLGYDKYDSPERSRDFFLAFRDLLLKHAVQDPVDFVLIAGDLFEYRSILPNVLNQAELALRPLQEAGIPVLAIEGNHDNRPFGVKTTWLRYLSDHDFLMLLEPIEGGDGIQLEPWNPEQKRGSYIDLDCGVRVIGSQWYGSAAPRSIQSLAAAVGSLPVWHQPTIVMFHHGLEGQIARYEGALRYADLLPLREVGVDYLALGHIHKHYSLENWIFNPGSTEANNIEESSFDRGGLRVTLTQTSTGTQIEAQLQQNYYQRPCHRLKIEAKGRETAEQIRNQILSVVTEAAKTWDDTIAPILEVKLSGSIGFERAELDARLLRRELQEMSQALLVLLKIEATPLALDTVGQVTDPEERMAVEEQVYLDIVAAKASYRDRGVELAQLLLDLKEMTLDERPPEQLYELLNHGFLEGSLPPTALASTAEEDE